MKTISYIRQLFHYLNMESELENHDRIHEEIIKGIVFKGTNLWILVFAIVVASVGLNMNSTAVIIGAMLISPLMGPINGIGYSIATYNFDLFRQSVKNFTFAVITSLVASTTYFAMSPISSAHSELLARTSPTIYDVMIALFGGLAGIVAISSRQKGNVIPGVAIATALMPPLCTAGYGLATAQFQFFLGAIYLFTINTVFIAIASMGISQVLKFPIRTIVEPAQKKRINRWISAVILIVLVPSIYFGYVLVQNERFLENAQNYISNVSLFEGNYLLKSEVNANSKNIILIYAGKNLSDSQKELIIAKAANFNLDKINVEIKQGFSFDSYDQSNEEVNRLREELFHLNNLLKEREITIDSLERINTLGKTLLKEVQILFPQVVACTYAPANQYSDTSDYPLATTVVILKTGNVEVSIAERSKIQAWIITRLDSRNTQVIFD